MNEPAATVATPDRYFDEQWAATSDPWDQLGRCSEQRKYDLTVASLPRPRYRRGFEPACATGSLTERLAARTDSLLACDRHPRPVAVTAERCASLPHVQVELLALPDWPDASFDLIVLSEVLYYFDARTIEVVLDAAQGHLEPGGHLVACHYRPHVAEHAVRGDAVHEAIGERSWRRLVEHRETTFVLEVFEA